MSDVSSTMSLDLNTILKDWPHENGNIKVRKIVGLEGYGLKVVGHRSLAS